MKHKNASPPMTPPTIAPVLVAEVAGASGTLVFRGSVPAEETTMEVNMEPVVIEGIPGEVDGGKVIEGLGRLDGVADIVEATESGVVEASRFSVLASCPQA